MASLISDKRVGDRIFCPDAGIETHVMEHQPFDPKIPACGEKLDPQWVSTLGRNLTAR